MLRAQQGTTKLSPNTKPVSVLVIACRNGSIVRNRWPLATWSVTFEGSVALVASITGSFCMKSWPQREWHFLDSQGATVLSLCECSRRGNENKPQITQAPFLKTDLGSLPYYTYVVGENLRCWTLRGPILVNQNWKPSNCYLDSEKIQVWAQSKDTREHKHWSGLKHDVPCILGWIRGGSP